MRSVEGEARSESRRRDAWSSEAEPPPTPSGPAYLFAAALSAATVAVVAIVRPWIFPAVYAPLFLAVVGSAWIGGVRAGILSLTLMATGAIYFLIEPIHEFGIRNPQDLIQLGVFGAVGLVIAALTDRARSTQLRLRRSAGALRQSEERLRLVTDALPSLVSYVDRSHRYLYNNRAYETWFGTTRERIQGKPVREVLGDAAYEAIRPHFDRALAGETVRFEARLPYREGGFRWVQATYIPHRTAPGEVAGMFVLVNDLTDRKRIEDELSDLNRGLERRVAERTAELEAAVGDLEEFTYTVAHDLRAPLRAMHGMSDLLAADHGADLRPEAREYLDRIAAASRRMDALIQDLLEYARIGRTTRSDGPIELGGVLEGLVRDLTPESRAKGASIVLDGPFPPVRGDRALLTQALLNLLENALRFVPAGRAPRVRVASQTREGRVRIRIEDNGGGIPEQRRGRLFRVFEPLDPHGAGGTGIGLAIVKRAVERMGGEAGYQPLDSRGSCFWIELPAAAAPAPASVPKERV